MEKKSLTEAIGRIMFLHGLFNFRKMFLDDSGLGGGPTDLLKDRLGHLPGNRTE